ncbi:MAG TPA: hypothetical protein PKD55_23495 [Bellilinea sp.]|nr:hypothetical protein [Bellilinea sp.]
MAWIYAFQDTGYEQGVKIGIDGTKAGLDRFKKAFCYTPRSMRYLAGWRVDPVRTGHSLRDLEKIAVRGLPPLRFDNNGTEWVKLTPSEAIEAVSQNLHLAPELLDRSLGKASRWDDFRNPADPGAMTTFRQVVWIYKEHLTGRVKTQRIDEWLTPRERVKTYSRNGFKPVCAFTYEGPVSLASNVVLHQTWLTAMSEFGPQVAGEHYGWLSDGIQEDTVASFYRTKGLHELSDFSEEGRPRGVRPAYNRPA